MLLFWEKILLNPLIHLKKKIKSKIVKSCKTKKRCIDKKVSNFKTHLSFKKQGKKSLKNLVINMRMSLIEL